MNRWRSKSHEPWGQVESAHLRQLAFTDYRREKPVPVFFTVLTVAFRIASRRYKIKTDPPELAIICRTETQTAYGMKHLYTVRSQPFFQHTYIINCVQQARKP